MDMITELHQLSLSGQLADIALLLPRVIFGAVFLSYGWPQIKDLKANARDFEEMGFKPGWLWGTPIAFLETFESLLVLAGVFLAFIPILFIVHMTVGTLWKVTSTEKPFSDWSYDLLLLSIAVMFLITGPGSVNLLAAQTGWGRTASSASDLGITPQSLCAARWIRRN